MHKTPKIMIIKEGGKGLVGRSRKRQESVEEIDADRSHQNGKTE